MKDLTSTLSILAKYKANIKPTPMDRFRLAEQKGRDLFTRWCISLKMVPRFDNTLIAAYDAYDAICNNNFYEIKYKQGVTFKSMQNLIKSEGLMLEEVKFKALREIWLKDQAKEFFYIMFFEDKTLVHRINFIDEKHYNKKVMMCPRTSMGNNEYIPKNIYLIPLHRICITDTLTGNR